MVVISTVVCAYREQILIQNSSWTLRQMIYVGQA